MRLNASTTLSTSKLLLVPYSKHHVPTYHTWMQDPDLREATASEPLSLDEEYDMQRFWREDRDKLTFIICQPLDNTANGETTTVIKPGVHDGPENMIGDINLFLFDSEEDEEDDAPSAHDTQEQRSVIGELELMIASPTHRRQGYGRAALEAFLAYISGHWDEISQEYSSSDDANVGVDREQAASAGVPRLQYLRVRIQETNVGSIRLFENLGFVRTHEGANYFGEVELRRQALDGEENERSPEGRRGSIGNELKELQYELDG
jgi:RimJ/RimL family protein N-acetyltransferase